MPFSSLMISYWNKLSQNLLYGFSLGKQALNPEHEAMGAMKAAYQFNPLSKLQVAGDKTCSIIS